LSYGPTND